MSFSMKTLCFIFMMMISHQVKSQFLNVKLFEDSFAHPFHELHSIITDHHHLTRVYSAEEDNQMVFTNNHPEKEKMVVATLLLRPRDKKNVLTVVVGKSVDLKGFKNELINNGFEYVGERKLSEEIAVFVYMKDKKTIIITKDLTKDDVYQIVAMP